MSDSRETIDLIKDRIDLITIAERYLKLEKTGKNYRALCPFHGEKTPSFYLNEETQRFKCFGCGESGDVFNLIQQIEGLDFYETLKKLAEETGVELQTNNTPNRFQNLYDLNQIASDYFYAQLLENKAAYKYVHEARQFSSDTIKTFQIGYAPGYNSLLKHIYSLKKHYSKQDLLESGLFKEKDGKLSDRFFNRITFPIRSTGGRVTAFSARAMPDNDYGPKYLNTSQTPIFSKKDILFALYEAKNNIRKADETILCEGQTDTIALHEMGFANTVAPLGTSLTTDQLDILKNYSENLTLLFDSDKAGIKAAQRAFKLATEIGMSVFMVNLPKKYKDIDEYRQADIDAAKQSIMEKQDAFSQLILHELRSADTTDLSDYKRLTQLRDELISGCPDDDLISFYNDRFDALIGGDKELSRNAPTQKNTKPSLGSDAAPPTAKPNLNDQEVYLITLIYKYGEYDKITKLNPQYFFNPKIKSLIQTYHDSEDPEVAYEASKADEFISDILFLSDEVPDIKGKLRDELKEVYQRIRKKYFSKLVEHYNQKLRIAEAENNTEDIDDLITKITKYNNLIKDLT